MPSYGIPEGVEGTLPWAWAEDRLAGAETYWVATTRPGGRFHLVPIWAAWLDGRLWFEGGVVIVNRTGDTLEIEYHVDLSGRDYVMRRLELRPGVMTLFAVPLGNVSPCGVGTLVVNAGERRIATLDKPCLGSRSEITIPGASPPT